MQGDSQDPFPQEGRVPPRRIPRHAKNQRPTVYTTNIATSTKNVLGRIVVVWRQEIIANWQTRILPGHLAFVSLRRLWRCFFFLTTGQILKATEGAAFCKRNGSQTPLSANMAFLCHPRAREVENLWGHAKQQQQLTAMLRTREKTYTHRCMASTTQSIAAQEIYRTYHI
jgi:hypothetical protein